MKLFEIDWCPLLEHYGALWCTLSGPTRARLLQLRPTDSDRGAEYGDELQALVSGEVLRPFADGERVRLTDAFRGSAKALRAMDRVRLPEDAGERVLELYLREHLTEDETSALVTRGWAPNPRAYAARLAADRCHVRGFLDAEDPAEWMAARRPEDRFRSRRAPGGTGSPPPSGRSAGDTKALVELLCAEPEPLPLRDLPGRLPGLSAPRLSGALCDGLRFLLCFATLSDAGEPTVTLWPAVRRSLQRPAEPVPEPVEPDATFDLPFRLSDVESLLVHASEPLRLKQGGDFYVRVRRDLEATLLGLPDWVVSSPVGATATAEIRIDCARAMADELGFVAVHSDGDGAHWLQTTDAGMAWLVGDPRTRLSELVGPVRTLGDATGDGPADPGEPDSDEERDLWRAGAAALETIPDDVSLRAFLRHRAESANPYREPGRLRNSLNRGWLPVTETEIDRAWGNDLAEMILQLLWPFGGVRLGSSKEGLTVALTETGRYLLGRRGSLPESEPAPRGAARPVLVQPNFEIVFTAPEPAFEAAIVRFAERLGSGVGTLFKITRASVHGAHRLGLGAEDVLSVLRRTSATPVPANVEHEIRAWAAEARTLDLQPALVVRCPDGETADRIVNAVRPGQVEALSETVLLVPQERDAAAVARACARVGVFLNRPRKAAASRARRTRRY